MPHPAGFTIQPRGAAMDLSERNEHISGQKTEILPPDPSPQKSRVVKSGALIAG